MRPRKSISLIWTLINEHYGISKARYRFRNKQQMWLPFVIAASIILMVVSLGPLYLGFIKMQYEQYSAVGLQNLMLSTTFTITSMIGFMFGMFMLVNEFYFSKNMRILITLPLKPKTVMASKLSVIIVDQMWISLVILLPTYVYFGILSSAGITFWISALVIFIFSQFIPILFQALIILPLSRIFKFSRHKDVMVMSLSVIILVVVFAFQYYVNMSVVSSDVSADEMVKMLSNPDGFLQRASMVYPPSFIAAKALSSTGFEWLGWLGLFIGINVVGFYLTLVFSNKFYYATYSEMQEQYSKKSEIKEGEMKSLFGTGRSKFKALYRREWQYFLKTPAFSFNGFANVLIFPIMVFMAVALKDMPQFKQLFSLVENYRQLIVPIGILGGTLSGSMNLLSSTLFSREGVLIRELKTMPVSVKQIFLAKYLQITLMSIIGPICFSIAFGIMFGVTFIDCLIIFVVAALCTNFLNFVQIIIDAKKPVLYWDNPQRAMKQNINAFFTIPIVFGFTGGMVGLGYLLKDSVDSSIMTLGLLLIGLLGSVVTYKPVLNSIAGLMKRDL